MKVALTLYSPSTLCRYCHSSQGFRMAYLIMDAILIFNGPKISSCAYASKSNHLVERQSICTSYLVWMHIGHYSFRYVALHSHRVLSPSVLFLLPSSLILSSTSKGVKSNEVIRLKQQTILNGKNISSRMHTMIISKLNEWQTIFLTFKVLLNDNI